LYISLSLVDKRKVGWHISHNSNKHKKGRQAKTGIQEALCIPQEKKGTQKLKEI